MIPMGGVDLMDILDRSAMKRHYTYYYSLKVVLEGVEDGESRVAEAPGAMFYSARHMPYFS